MTQRHIAWAFVGAQLVLLVAIVAVPGGDDWSVTLGVDIVAVLLGLVGLGLGLWAVAYLGRGLTASPLPNGAVDLVSTGPYRRMRHPMYLAVMAFALAVALRSANWAAVALFVALVGLFNWKARWEEERLHESFAGYEAYRARTGRFLPELRGSPE